jgi:hypothetical protein
MKVVSRTIPDRRGALIASSREFRLDASRSYQARDHFGISVA